MLAGLVAAWPFRHSPPAPPVQQPAAALLELTLRPADAPLRLAPTSDISPAVGLERVPPQPSAADFTNLAPPPALPVSFQPAELSPQSSDWRPESPLKPMRLRGKPRTYRLRDGDTLEGIAERFLGNRARAEEIFQNNRNVLAQPDLLPVGTSIVIPPRQTADELEPVKRD